MGREVRRVPEGWEHPRDEEGRYVPLLGGDFSADEKEWEAGLSLWCRGLRDDYEGGQEPHGERRDIYGWVAWNDGSPRREDYMPAWLPEQRTHFMMYETTSEGTPISPACGQRCGACIAGPPLSGLPSVASAGSGVASVPLMGQVTFDAGTAIEAGEMVVVTPSGTVVPAQREPVAPWVRLETPGKYSHGEWVCTAHGERPGEGCAWPLAHYARTSDGSPVDAKGERVDGACEDCAEAAGVFGPVAAYQSASSSGYAAGGISAGRISAGSGTPWSPSIGAPIVTVRKWKCAYAWQGRCKTPESPMSQRVGYPGAICTDCDERDIVASMEATRRRRVAVTKPGQPRLTDRRGVELDARLAPSAIDASMKSGAGSEVSPRGRSPLERANAHLVPRWRVGASDVEVKVDLDELP